MKEMRWAGDGRAPTERQEISILHAPHKSHSRGRPLTVSARARLLAGCPILIWWRFFRHAIPGDGKGEKERERRVANDTSIIYAHRQSDFNLAISSLSLSVPVVRFRAG